MVIIISDFNSIKVQLKPQGNIPPCLADLFQFHKGTIKTGIHAGEMLHDVISIP